MASAAAQSFAQLVAERRIIVCVGSGGVGKTTTAATLALAGARAGRRTLVMTIDPARRLANALGIAQLDHQERRVDDEKVAAGGVSTEGGSLHAMMLDQKRAFDEVVERYANDPQLLGRIRNNRIYQQISTTLTGSHEYAAMAKLYDLAHPREGERRYDLIVLDTPPTANALDFLDAPEKLVGAIDSPAMRWFLKPYLEGKSFSFQVVGFFGASIIKRLAKFVGARFLHDMAEFLGEFQSVLAGFRQRAADVSELLRRPDAAFAVICSPEPLSVDEAIFFHGRLSTNQMPMGGFVVNRVHPIGPPLPGRAEVLEKLEGRTELRGFAPDDLVQVAADLGRTYGDFQALAEIDAKQIERLRAADPRGLLARVPLFDRDIYDVEGLMQVAAHLLV